MNLPAIDNKNEESVRVDAHSRDPLSDATLKAFREDDVLLSKEVKSTGPVSGPVVEGASTVF
ncbi:hypothetical protein TSUD_35410 [Trifolium subterraneum]|uniref:Uncharacterized protein n=1 Tax=Trifolium subterraneum TaxID=3900 RepID=A0A2Z6LUM3_TRISU|nr:hypothetical protein TSUD_35410 [Trifolium subterraneum]